MTKETNLVKTKKWKGFFNNFSIKNTVLIQKHFLEIILKHTCKDDTLVEVAAGSGYTSMVLYHSGRRKVICSDIEDELLSDIKILEPSMSLLKLNAFDMKGFGPVDCIFHQGFLEHFDDSEILQILNEQAKTSKLVIFDVPNARRWKKIKEYGNERFLYHREWKNLIKRSNLEIIEESARRMPSIFKYLPCFFSESLWIRKRFGTASIFVCKGNI